MARPDPKLIVDWKRPPPREPQASLARFAPDLEVAHAHRTHGDTRRRAAPRPRAPRQLALDTRRESDPGNVVALELRAPNRLTSVAVQMGPHTRAPRRSDERVRSALLAACADGADRDGAVLEAARECAVPASALGFVEALLEDLILEGEVIAYGDVLYTRRARRRKVVAVEVGDEDLMDLLSKGHRVLELK